MVVVLALALTPQDFLYTHFENYVKSAINFSTINTKIRFLLTFPGYESRLLKSAIFLINANIIPEEIIL